jgi:hypothetical protein
LIIKYIHASEPETEKTYDTEKSLKNNPFIHMSQEEFDEMEVKRFERDENIIWFEVIKM